MKTPKSTQEILNDLVDGTLTIIAREEKPESVNRTYVDMTDPDDGATEKILRTVVKTFKDRVETDTYSYNADLTLKSIVAQVTPR